MSCKQANTNVTLKQNGLDATGVMFNYFSVVDNFKINAL